MEASEIFSEFDSIEMKAMVFGLWFLGFEQRPKAKGQRP